MTNDETNPNDEIRNSWRRCAVLCHSCSLIHSAFVIRAWAFAFTFFPARRCRAISSHVAGRVQLDRTVPIAMNAPVLLLSRPGRLRKKCESCLPARTSNWPEYSDENHSAPAERFRQIG